MISASTLRMLGLAILGLLVAGGVAVAASHLASRQIGLASEPVSAGDELAPAATRPGKDNKTGGHQDGTAEEAEPATPSAPTPRSGEGATAPEAPSSPSDSPTSERGAGEASGEGETRAGGGGGDD